MIGACAWRETSCVEAVSIARNHITTACYLLEGAAMLSMVLHPPIMTGDVRAVCRWVLQLAIR